MTVCQGCGRSCDTELCCPSCASFDRSSFFCSQECFTSNWKEHSKLHAILKQQQQMTEQDTRERKIKGLSAANAAISAISDLISNRAELHPTASAASTRHATPKRVNVLSRNSISEDASIYKDHQLKPIDKVIGPNGVFRGFRVIVLFSITIFIIFYKINSLISEIPVVVEKKVAEKRVSETLGIQVKAADKSGGVLLSNSKTSGVVSIAESHEVASVLIMPQENETIKNLRGEVESLKKQLEQYKSTSVQNVTSDSFSVNVTELVPAIPGGEIPPVVGMVRNEEAPMRALMERVGVVRSQ